MNASEPERVGRLRAKWRSFRVWRGQRPFGAGLCLVPAGVAIGLPPYASFRLGDVVLSVRTIGGMSAVVIAALLLVCAVSLWVRPQYRVAAGVTAIVVSLAALVSSNLGGFLLGTVLGLVGGALAVSWAPADRGPGPFRSVGAAVFLVVVLAVPAAFPFVHEGAATVSRPRAAMVGGVAGRGVPSGGVWVLTASVLRLSGLRYLGVGTTRVGGVVVEVLRFTARRVEMTSLIQVSELVDGHVGTISAPPGSVPVATGDPVELLTLRLAGTLSLLGLIGIPVDFTPAHPPPLVLPEITFTDVTVVNTDLGHARLTIPRARITIT